MKPAIGITCSFDPASGRNSLPSGYDLAVLEAGGLPLLLSNNAVGCVDALLSLCDGLLLSGGVDVNPVLFDQQPHPQLGEICPQRDEMELALCRAALAAGKPIFGVCRGIQLLNLVCGGTLVQDLPSERPDAIKHSQQCPSAQGTHWVSVRSGSLLHRIIGKDRLLTNSHHHQAVAGPAPGFAVSAVTADGVVEAIERADRWVLGVQWHPENMRETPDSRALFQAFVAACRQC